MKNTTDLEIYSGTDEDMALLIRELLNKWTFGANFYVDRNQFTREPFVVTLINGKLKTASVQSTIIDFAAGIAFALEHQEEIEIWETKNG